MFKNTNYNMFIAKLHVMSFETTCHNMYTFISFFYLQPVLPVSSLIGPLILSSSVLDKYKDIQCQEVEVAQPSYQQAF